MPITEIDSSTLSLMFSFWSTLTPGILILHLLDSGLKLSMELSRLNFYCSLSFLRWSIILALCLLTSTPIFLIFLLSMWLICYDSFAELNYSLILYVSMIRLGCESFIYNVYSDSMFLYLDVVSFFRDFEFTATFNGDGGVTRCDWSSHGSKSKFRPNFPLFGDELVVSFWINGLRCLSLIDAFKLFILMFYFYIL